MRFSLKTLQKDLRTVTGSRSSRFGGFGPDMDHIKTITPEQYKKQQRVALEEKMNHNLDMYKWKREFNTKHINIIIGDLKKLTNPQAKIPLYNEMNNISVQNIQLEKEYNAEYKKNNKLLAELKK